MSSEKQRTAFGLRVPGWRAWIGLLVAPILWAIHHQLGSNLSFAACDRGPERIALIVGIIALLFIAGTGWLGWRSWRRAGGTAVEEADALQIFIPLLSVMSATIFGLTVFVQLLADVILPPCFG
jgi:hypothetical protein